MSEETETQAELAPNMWFTEYGMPYTTMILENEAYMAKEYPDAEHADRHPLAQFIIDQETAVARDYIEGRISETEFEAFKEASQAQIDELGERVEKEMEELQADGEDWAEDYGKSVEAFVTEHKGEIEHITDVAATRELEASDLSLHLVADYLGTSVDGVDKLMEKLPPHLHDIVDVLESGTLESAHELVDARAELSSADEHDLRGEREALEVIEPTFEAEMDVVHEDIDASFEKIDQTFEVVQGEIDVAREHAEMNPDTTVEHFPYKITEDYDAMDDMEEETGVSQA